MYTTETKNIASRLVILRNKCRRNSTEKASVSEAILYKNWTPAKNMSGCNVRMRLHVKVRLDIVTIVSPPIRLLRFGDVIGRCVYPLSAMLVLHSVYSPICNNSHFEKKTTLRQTGLLTRMKGQKENKTPNVLAKTS